MAIKGKKKSGSRGSQARRRPAAAPRPTAAAHYRTPWHRTAAGQVVAGILIMVLLGGIVGAIAKTRSNTAAKEKRLDAVETYSSDVRGLLQAVRGPAGAMTEVPPTPPKKKPYATLAKDADGWIKSLQEAQAKLPPAPPEALANANALFGQSLQMFVTAARTYMLVPDVTEEKAQTELVARASEQRSHADAIWISAVGFLDEELIEQGGTASGLGSPGTAPAGSTPQVPPGTEVPPGSEIPPDIQQQLEEQGADQLEIPAGGDKKKKKKK